MSQNSTLKTAGLQYTKKTETVERSQSIQKGKKQETPLTGTHTWDGAWRCYRECSVPPQPDPRE